LTGLKHIVAIDLDDVIVDGEISSEAQAILDRADSYAERTPSGTGLRVIGTTRRTEMVHKTIRLRQGHAEIYAGGARRYITVSAQQVGNQTRLKNIDDAVDLLLKLNPKPSARTKASATTVNRTGEMDEPNELKAREARRLLKAKMLPGDRSRLVYKVCRCLIEGGLTDPDAIYDQVVTSNLWQLLRKPHRGKAPYTTRRLERDIEAALGASHVR
jgi:hypothetical protein